MDQAMGFPLFLWLTLFEKERNKDLVLVPYA